MAEKLLYEVVQDDGSTLEQVTKALDIELDSLGEFKGCLC